MARINKIILGLLLVFGGACILSAQQQNQKLNWSTINDFKVFGSLNSFEGAKIQRFPDSLQKDLRERLWKLSENTAGLYLKFKSDAPFIQVTYKPNGVLSFPHMPSTGVSGLDLYIKNQKDFMWVRGNYSFKDQVQYTYAQMEPTDRVREFWLYLPLFQSIEDFQIGVPKGYSLTPILETPTQNPIIIYGTSIAQGACASRAGMAWTNILGRTLSPTVVNLGFSGNGRLETAVIDYISNFDASVFVLDCMANFTSGQGLNPEAARTRLTTAIIKLKQKHPNTPILLVEHAGYSDGEIQKERYITYSRLNQVTKEVYTQMKVSYNGLYLLTKQQIGLTADSFVDGTHPNDYGMLQYSKAYKIAIDSILN